MSDRQTEKAGLESDRAECLWTRYREHSDLGALGDLFDLCAPELLRIGLRLTGELDSAEDLVQDTFLRALRAAPRYRPQGHGVRAWLSTILRNRARSLRRGPLRALRSRHRAFDSESTGLELADPSPLANPLGQVASRELWVRLREAIAALPEPYRTVCGLRFRHDLDAPAIATALERPLNTVQSQLRRGTQRLRERLGEGALGALVTTSWESTQSMNQARELVLHEASQITIGNASAVTTVSGSLTLGASALLLLCLGSAYLIWVKIETPRTPAPTTQTASRDPETIDTFEVDDVKRSETPIADEVRQAKAGWPSADRIGLDVLDGRTDAPISGATIRHARSEVVKGEVRAALDTDLPPELYWPTLGLLNSDPERYWELNGTSSQSDENGRLDLPKPLTWRISGRLGDLYGDTGWDQNCEVQDGRMVLRLYPDGYLRVKVFDFHGEPVPNAGVVLRSGGHESRRSRARRGGRTNGDGVAVLPHVPTFARTLLSEGGTTAVLNVYHDSGEQRIGEWPLSELLDPGPDGHCLDQPAIDFRLPEARGPIVVRVINPLGKPPLSAHPEVWAEREWSPMVDVTLEELNDQQGRRPRRLVSRPLVEGIASFKHPPPGRRLRVDCLGSSVEIPAAGPGSDAIYVDIHLPGEDHASIGRAVGPDGLPLRNRFLMISGVPYFHGGVATDEDGRFVLYQWSSGESAVLHARVAETLIKPCGRLKHLLPTSLVSSTRLEAVQPGSVRELGDLTFERRDPIATGEFQFPPTMSFEEAQLWLSWQLRVESLRNPVALTGLDPKSASPQWERLEDAFAVLADDGRFELFGELGDSSRLRVGVPHGGSFRPVSLPIPFVEFVPGQTDLALEYQVGGALEVHQLDDDRQPDVHIELELLDGSPIVLKTNDRGTRHLSAPGEPKRHFFHHLLPGSYRVTLTTEFLSDPIAVFNDVEVQAGETTVLLQDSPIDLIRYYDGRLLTTRSSIDGTRVRTSIWLDCRELTDLEARIRKRTEVPNQYAPAPLTFPRQQVHALAVPRSPELGVVRFEPGALSSPNAEIVLPPATPIEVPLPAGITIEEIAAAPITMLPGNGWDEWMQAKALSRLFRNGMRWQGSTLRATLRCAGRWRVRLEAKDGRVWEADFDVQPSEETLRVEVDLRTR